MSYSKNIRESARDLRKRGKTYSEIKKLIEHAPSKSTLSLWSKDIILPEGHIEKIAKLNAKNLKQAQRASYISKKLEHENILKDFRTQSRNLGKKLDCYALKIALAMLYLGEGSKWKSHRGLMLGNSDARIILLYIKLLHACYGIIPSKLKCRISYRADQNIEFLQRYWSKTTRIPPKNFYKTKPDPRTIGIPTHRKDYKGVCVIMCGGTDIQLELDIIAETILESIVLKGL